jgi:putative membrane protein
MKKIATTGLMACAFMFGTIACGGSGTDSVDEAQDRTEERFEDTAMEDRRVEASEFMTKAASSSMMEVEAGKLAQQRATNPQVKEFASMMVKDHTAANNELRQLATSKNITLPDSMSNDHMDHMRDLREHQGADFDREYMDRMVSAHDNDISLFEDVADDNNFEDAEVRAFANKTLPKLRQHHQRAQQIKDGLPRR